MNTVRLKCDCCKDSFFFFLADVVTGNNCNKASIIHLVVYLWPASPLTAERFCYCLRSNNVLTSSDGDYAYSPIYNPHCRWIETVLREGWTLPGVTALSHPPLQHPCLRSIVIPWVIAPCQRWAFSLLGAAVGSMFPNPSRRFFWLTGNRTLSYNESKLHCTKEWNQRS